MKNQSGQPVDGSQSDFNSQNKIQTSPLFQQNFSLSEEEQRSEELVLKNIAESLEKLNLGAEKKQISTSFRSEKQKKGEKDEEQNCHFNVTSKSLKFEESGIEILNEAFLDEFLDEEIEENQNFLFQDILPFDFDEKQIQSSNLKEEDPTQKRKEKESEEDRKEEKKRKCIFDVNQSSISGDSMNLTLENTYIFKKEELESKECKKQEKTETTEKNMESEMAKAWKKLLLKLNYKNCQEIILKEIQTSCETQIIRVSKFSNNLILQLHTKKFKTTEPNCDNDVWDIGNAKNVIKVIGVKLTCFECKTKNWLLMRDNMGTVICQKCHCSIDLQIQVSLE